MRRESVSLPVGVVRIRGSGRAAAVPTTERSALALMGGRDRCQHVRDLRAPRSGLDQFEPADVRQQHAAHGGAGQLGQLEARRLERGAGMVAQGERLVRCGVDDSARLVLAGVQRLPDGIEVEPVGAGLDRRRAEGRKGFDARGTEQSRRLTVPVPAVHVPVAVVHSDDPRLDGARGRRAPGAAIREAHGARGGHGLEQRGEDGQRLDDTARSAAQEIGIGVVAEAQQLRAHPAGRAPGGGIVPGTARGQQDRVLLGGEIQHRSGLGALDPVVHRVLVQHVALGDQGHPQLEDRGLVPLEHPLGGLLGRSIGIVRDHSEQLRAVDPTARPDRHDDVEQSLHTLGSHPASVAVVPPGGVRNT